MKKFETIIIIKWGDVVEKKGWIEKNEMEELLKDDEWKTPKSVGFYCGETEDVIIISQDVMKTAINGVSVIPKKSILEIKEIKIGD